MMGGMKEKRHQREKQDFHLLRGKKKVGEGAMAGDI